jgi:PAS domain S-box-containing protein
LIDVHINRRCGLFRTPFFCVEQKITAYRAAQGCHAMADEMNTITNAAELRRKAEEQVASQQPPAGELDVKRLLHELQVYQVELEMQNEELRQAIVEKSEHEEHLRNIIQQTPAGYFRINRDGYFLDVNDAWLRMHCYDSKDEVIGKHFSMMQVNSSLSSAHAHLAELQRGVAIPCGEFESLRKDGSIGHHIFSAHPVVHVGAIVGFEWFIIDISERKKVEEQLQNSEKQYRSLYEMMDEGYCVVDLIYDSNSKPMDLRFLETNPAFEKQTGLHQALGKTMRQFVPDFEDFWFETYNEVIRTGESKRFESQSVAMEKFYDVFAFRLSKEGNQSVGILFNDITERKLLEQKLMDLNEHLLTVQEKERLAISRDIHDDFGQNLTVLRLDLEMINLKKCTDCKILDESLTSMRKNIDLSTAKVQQVASNLRPPLLDSVGLAAAIEWQINEVRKRSAIEFFVLLNEDTGSLDQKVSTAMMRIFQEGLTNIVRHSQAKEVTVSLCKRDDRILLELTDNGCGITPEQIASSESFGLMGMNERARSCGGDLRIFCSPEGGTTLDLSIPLNTGVGIV